MEHDESDTGVCYKRWPVYFNGKEVPQDYPNVMRYSLETANIEDADSQIFLGIMYQEGRYSNQNYSTAVE